ncbi:hypothetical protein [Porcipelethomonas sp.]|uniref:hypothetical protein n=1 Tax=Porcipelethomonas sp. TaxID=2981675 RepID=UPI003EF6D41E
MKKMEKYIPNLILSIIMVFALLGTECLVFAKTQVLNEQTYINAVEKNHVSQKVLNEIENYFEKSSNYSRIPAEVYMSAVSEELVEDAIEQKISRVFDYITGNTNEIADAEIDFEELEKSISDYFEKFAEENNVEVNDDYNSQLQKTVDTARNEIDNFTDVYMLSYINKTGVLSKVRTVYGLLDTASAVMAGVVLVCIILIFIMNLKKKSYFLYWISSVLICSSVIVLIPGLYIRLSGYTQKLVIRNDYIYSAVTGAINDINDKLIYAQAAALILGIIIMVIFAFASKPRNAEN